MNACVDLTNVKLETDRLILRSWREEDLMDFYEYAKVDGVGQMAGWNPHESIDISQQILDEFISEKKTFALQLKSNGKVIGSIGLEELSIDLGDTYIDKIGREIGYVLSKEYWGKGIMPEAVKKVIEYLFNKEHYDFMLCSHNIINHQSQRVIEKCGFLFIKEEKRTSINGEEHFSKYYILRNPSKWNS